MTDPHSAPNRDNTVTVFPPTSDGRKLKNIDKWNDWRQGHSDITPDLSRLVIPTEAGEGGIFILIFFLVICGGGGYITNHIFLGVVLSILFSIVVVGLLVDSYSVNKKIAPNLKHADLSAVNFDGSSFRGLDFSGANLEGASFKDAYIENCIFEGAQLKDTVFSRASISKANFRKANLTNSDLRSLNLKDAIFEKANLSQADLAGSNLTNADLSEAKLFEANLTETELFNTNFVDADLRHAVARKANFEKAEMAGANLSHADLSAAKFIVTELVAAELNKANLKEALFDSSNLYGSELIGADLENATFASSELSKANCSKANFSGCDLSATRALGANFSGANLTGACVEDWGINSNTNLSDVICDHIYLRASTGDNISCKFKERRPAVGDFAPNEFVALFQRALDTVDLIFVDGLDWRALLKSLDELRSQHEDVGVRAIEKNGQAFIVRLEVADKSDKASIEHRAKELYRENLAILESSYKAELQAKEREIEIYKSQNTSMEEIVKALATRTPTSEKHVYDLRNSQFAGGFAETVRGNQASSIPYVDVAVNSESASA